MPSSPIAVGEQPVKLGATHFEGEFALVLSVDLQNIERDE